MSHLVTVDHEVVCSDEGFKHNHPAGVGGPLKQRVSQLGNVHVHLVGAMNQILKQKRFHTVKLVFNNWRLSSVVYCSLNEAFYCFLWLI